MKTYYLMLKIHLRTGLKYLCYTTRKDPVTYWGSGTHWRRHLGKHGWMIGTEVLLTTTDYDELKRVATNLSMRWNIVDDPSWANLKMETGDGGWDHIHRNQELYNEKNRQWWDGLSEEERKKLNKKKSLPKEMNSRWGMKLSEEERTKISARTRDAMTNPVIREKISAKAKGRMVVKDAVTGEIKGKYDTDHPKILSGEWVPQLSGTKPSVATRTKMSETHRRIGNRPPSPKGKLWWNNGRENYRGEECPGEEWKRGRLPWRNKDGKELLKGHL